MTIIIFLCSCLFWSLSNAHSSASPSIFSFNIPSFIIRPKFRFDLLQGASADLYIMCLRSFNLPGRIGFPESVHNSRDCPPFQALVVKPRTSAFTPHRSRVLVNISAQVAATIIGRPLIDPELSISNVTTVSLKSVSLSILNDNGCIGSVTTRTNLAVSSAPSSKSKSHERFCWAINFLWSLFANLATIACRFDICLSK